MNQEKRLKLIRNRINSHSMSAITKPAGMYCKAKGLQPSKRKRICLCSVEPLHTHHSYRQEITGESPGTKRPKWLYKPDKRKKAECSIKRTEKVSALTMIALKWDQIKSAQWKNFG